MTAQLSSDEGLWEQELRTVVQPADVWVSPPREPGKFALVCLVWIGLFSACCAVGWGIAEMCREAITG